MVWMAVNRFWYLIYQPFANIINLLGFFKPLYMVTESQFGVCSVQIFVPIPCTTKFVDLQSAQVPKSRLLRSEGQLQRMDLRLLMLPPSLFQLVWRLGFPTVVSYVGNLRVTAGIFRFSSNFSVVHGHNQYLLQYTNGSQILWNYFPFSADLKEKFYSPNILARTYLKYSKWLILDNYFSQFKSVLAREEGTEGTGNQLTNQCSGEFRSQQQNQVTGSLHNEVSNSES